MTRPAAASPAGTAPLATFLDRAISEAAFTRRVTDLADVYHWTWYHPWLSVKSKRGYPDLTLARLPHRGESVGRVLFVELKRESGKMTDAQITWQVLLKAAGADARCWRPSDWSEIVEVLAR